MFVAKKITPPASPARIADSSERGGLRPAYEYTIRCPASCGSESCRLSGRRMAARLRATRRGGALNDERPSRKAERRLGATWTTARDGAER